MTDQLTRKTDQETIKIARFSVFSQISKIDFLPKINRFFWFLVKQVFKSISLIRLVPTQVGTARLRVSTASHPVGCAQPR
jgi:hypothetical protein